MSLLLPKKEVSLLVVALGSPLLVGVYYQGKLEESYSDIRPTSDALPLIVQQVVEKYTIEKLAYAKGPGSFMAIKVAYVVLSTLSTVYSIPLLACDGFTFNDATPIKAIGKKFFVKEGDDIVLKDNDVSLDTKSFELPLVWDDQLFTQSNEPLYVLPAI